MQTNSWSIWHRYTKRRKWHWVCLCFCPCDGWARTRLPRRLLHTGRRHSLDIHCALERRPCTHRTNQFKHAQHLPFGTKLPQSVQPHTTIRYQLPVASMVKLEVYDVLGKKVATLVSERQPAGYYQFVWNASGLSSGTYFYRLQAGGFVETKKMMLVK